MCQICSRRNLLKAGLGAAATVLTAACAPFKPAPTPTPTPPPVVQSADWLRVFWEAEKVEKGIQTDTVFIHHTAGSPGMTWQELSDLQLKRLYAPRFASADRDPDVRGKEPHSGHFRLAGGMLVPVFYTYHWIIRESGEVERLLNDTEVGWHAGKWQENMRSLTIVFDGDFTTGEPTTKAQKAAWSYSPVRCGTRQRAFRNALESAF